MECIILSYLVQIFHKKQNINRDNDNHESCNELCEGVEEDEEHVADDVGVHLAVLWTREQVWPRQHGHHGGNSAQNFATEIFI